MKAAMAGGKSRKKKWAKGKAMGCGLVGRLASSCETWKKTWVLNQK